jgi:hypothetical protein
MFKTIFLEKVPEKLPGLSGPKKKLLGFLG